MIDGFYLCKMFNIYIFSKIFVKCNEELLCPGFCYYLLPTRLVKNQLSAGAQQTSIRHTSPDKIKDCKVFIQSLSEQKTEVHPPKFRRTLATMAIDKGMPIVQVQRLLGPGRIDTTLHYAIVNQNNVKMAHKKYLG